MSKPSPAEPAKTQKPVKQSVTASKKVPFNFKGLNNNPDLYFLNYLFRHMKVCGGFLINKIYIYQTERTFDDVRKGQFLHILMYGIPFAIFYTIADLIVHKIFDGLCDKYFINHAKFADQQSRKKRCYTLVKWGFSILYYGFSSLAAFLLLKKTSYFPTWLGGSGSPENIYNDFPQNSQFSSQIQVFYILQFGKHFSRTFGHFFIRPQGNFYEYGLHHILSISLILFSYTMDHWLIGTFVLLVHDFTDLTLIFARGYREYRYRSQKVLQIFYVSAFVSWILCRIFIFSYAFIYGFNKGIFEVLLPKMENILPPIYKQTMFFPALFMSGMLITLEGLQIFWTYYILRSYIAVSVSSKIASHNYD